MTLKRYYDTDQLPADARLLMFAGSELIAHSDTSFGDAGVFIPARCFGTPLWYRHIRGIRWRRLGDSVNAPLYTAQNKVWQTLPEHLPALRTVAFRALLPELSALQFEQIATASQLLTWEQDHNFCCRCGATTYMHSEENAMCCNRCGYRQYPRINPCIIALITRGDEVLLAHNANFKPGYFSCIAGFIEPGESVEQAVHREIAEEVGVMVGNLRYLGSQSWPFPHSLMLGFICEYTGGEVVVDGKEITEARWGRLESFTSRPGDFSISGQLMAAFERELQHT